MAEKDELLDHNYDGIQEYDNDLPRWWLAIFVLTTIYAIWYVAYYHFGNGLLAKEQLAMDMAALEELKEKIEAAETPADTLGEKELLALSSNEEALKNGAEIFATKCLACHGAQGQGLVGPNLTDEYWVHGGKLTDIRSVVINGVVEKGMLAWKGILTDEEVNNVVAYIWSLQGTNPPNAKAPEGDKVVE